MRTAHAVVAFALGVSLAAAVRAQTAATLVRPHGSAPAIFCGTTQLDTTRSLRVSAATPLADGEPLSFEQDPPLVPPDFTGTVALRQLEVVGDIRSITFRRPLRAGGSAAETWPRVGTRAIDGRLVSIFEPAWDAAALDEALSLWTWGFDSPGLYWGTIEVPQTAIVRPVFLRMALGGIRASTIVRVDDRVQYASNVVNIVVPGFGDARAAGGDKAFELTQAARVFYSRFSDAYDVIAVVPQAAPLAPFGAFHQIVQNRVAGLNLPMVDATSQYGSVSVLQGIEVFTGVTGATYEQTNHEMAHQWGSNFDWMRIAGIARAGHEPSVHAPLWTGGETLVGAVLSGDRRVRALADGYAIERTPAPARFHPLELYAMGALPPSRVGDFGVFVDQEQFDGVAGMPAAGTPLRGGVRPVTIDDVMREHGIRSGPSPSVWRRATVLVSRERLASRQEMDYWNFFAQRLAGGGQPDAPTTAGFVPFTAATNGTVTLKTAVRPRDREPLPETLDVAHTPFGAGDWRGVRFTAPVARRYAAGTATTISGRVETDGIEGVQIVLWRDGVEPIVFAGAVARSGDFDVTLRFTDAQRGPYAATVYLVSSGDAPHYAAGSLSTVTIE